MPSTLADTLYYRLVEAFPAHRAYTPAAFSSTSMPSSVAHFLARLLHRRLEYEAQRLDFPRSEWFDYSHADVDQAQQSMRRALAQHGHFPAAEWEAALHQAVHQVTAFLVRPTATLLTFIYQDSSAAMNVADINRRLGYFADYAYLSETVRMYVKQKQVRTIDKKQFSKLLHHIDQHMTKEYEPDAWVGLLQPLFGLSREASADGMATIPLSLLHTFFSEKGVTDVARRLEQIQGADALDEEGIRRLFEPEEPPAPIFDPAVLVPQEEPIPVSPVSSPIVEEEPKGPVPLWKKFQQERAPVASSATKIAPKPEAPAPSEKGQAVPLWQQYRAAPEPEAPAPRPSAPPSVDLVVLEGDVLGEVGSKNRELFVRHLFAGIVDEYERVLRRLKTVSTWPDASQIIAEEVFRKNQVNIYSDPAVLFTDAVEARFWSNTG